jgi:hypothetical protein
MILARLSIAIMFAASALNAYALSTEEEQAIEAKQMELDQRCEAARDIKLGPVRSQIFDECMSAAHSTDTETDCRRKAATYNANRKNGSPLYYDLPQCVAAFEHNRSKNQ